MVLETKRMILRQWEESDAENLYKYAKNPIIGPRAGWPPHTSVENSREIIRDILSADEIYAVTFKDSNNPIGNIGFSVGSNSPLNLKENEGEIGYWLGTPFWGQELIPEAGRELIRHGFEDLKFSAIWLVYFEENKNSKRISEKLGFKYHHTETNIKYPLIDEDKTQIVTRLTRREWRNGIITIDDLFENIDKIHTTKLGLLRIKKNLNLATDDVVVWCKEQIKDKDKITQKGKNWYVRGDGFVITINAHSYTIITAHKEKERNI